MTVETTRNKSGPYTVMPDVLAYARKFRIDDPKHLRVIHHLDGVERDLATGFIHTGIGADEGEVVFTSFSLPAGGQIILLRAVPNLQEIDYANQARVRPETVERSLDLLTMELQDIAERQGRAVTLGPFSEMTGGEISEIMLNAPRYADEAKRARDEAITASQSYTIQGIEALRMSSMTLDVGSTILTRAESASYEVVPSGSADYAIATASGMLLRPSKMNQRVTPRMWGAVGDGAADDVVAIQKCWDFAGLNLITADMEGLQYNCSNSLFTSSNLYVKGNWATLYITDYTTIGGFVNNVRVGSYNGMTSYQARIQSNIYIEELITDGSKLPNPSFPSPSRNWLTGDNTIGGAGWSVSSLTATASPQTPPGASSVAYRLTDTADNVAHMTSQTTARTATVGVTHSFNVIAKAGTISKIGLSMSGAMTFGRVTFDLATGKVSGIPAGFGAQAVDMANGFYALSIWAEATVAAPVIVGIYMANAAGAYAYSGGAGTVHVWGAWTENSAGHNLNLGPEFAWGASHVRVVNCIARKIDFGFGGGTGGAGFGGEQGLDDVQFIGCVAEDCYRGVRLAGIPGNHDPARGGQSKRATNIVFRDFTARRCGAALLIHSIGYNEDSTTGFVTTDAVFDGLKMENCGHAPWLPIDYDQRPGISPQKSGAIVAAGGHNTRFSRVRLRIDSNYTSTPDWMGRTSYPAAGTNRVGAGLSGPVGAVVWGWGMHTSFDDVTLDGQVDVLWKCARAVAFGEIASVAPTSTGGGADGIVSMNFRDFRVQRGTVSQYAFDSMTDLDGSRFNARMTLSLHAALSGGMIGPNGTAGLNTFTLEFRSSSGSAQIGSAAQWLARGNAVKTGAQTFSLKGGIDLGSGYSPTGGNYGLTYDAADGTARMSNIITGSQSLFNFYNPNGYVGGIVTNGTSTAYNTSSDARLKSDPKEFDALAIIDGFNVYDFAWNSGGRGYGVFAQEAALVMPDAVTVGDDDAVWEEKGLGERMPWSVNYTSIVPVLIRAIQQQQDEIDNLKSRLGV